MHPTAAPLPGESPPIGHNSRHARGETCPTCGQDYEKERSKEQHNLLFAVIKEAFGNWPESHAFQPTCEKHLRGWLLVEADHTISVDMVGVEQACVENARSIKHLLAELGSSDTAILAMRLMRLRDETGKSIGVRTIVPKSVSRTGPKKISKTEFESVSNRVFELIEAITGASIETFKMRAKYGAP